jgi:pimeloyl-ACP methyl ester carboxylesterase
VVRSIEQDRWPTNEDEEDACVTENQTPVVFIHGLWLHASSWGPWMDVFRAAGYEPSAPGWPGTPDTVEAARTSGESIAGKGISDVVDHYTKLIGDLAAAGRFHRPEDRRLKRPPPTSSRIRRPRSTPAKLTAARCW